MTIAALTAHALEEEKVQIIDAGCDEFVRKPFREQEVFEVMAKHLELRYVYQEDQDATLESDIEPTPLDLVDIPAGLLESLHQAALELDTDRTLKLIDRIEALEPGVARTLRALAQKFEYGRLLSVLKSQGETE